MPTSSRPHLINKNLPLFLAGVAFLFILLGAGSIFFLQMPLQEQQFDTRSAATQPQGQIILSANFQDASTTRNDAQINLTLNTHGVQTDGVQVILNIVTQVTDGLTMSVPNDSGLHATHQEVERTNDGFLVSIKVVPNTGTFSSDQDKTFSTIQFRPNQAGQLRLNFDEDNSRSNIANSNPAVDVLKTIPSFIFLSAGPTIVATTTGSNTTNDDLFFDSPKMSIHFYKNDGSNQEVSQSNLQINTTYKVVTSFQVQNQIKNQEQDNRSFVVQYFRNGTSITSKVYTYAFVRQHRDGFSDAFTDTVNFQSTNQFALVVDSTNALGETNEQNNNWTFTVNSNAGKVCNASCSSNAECGTNLRCYNNQCRLAINVSSESCSAPADLGLQRKCNEYCANTGECASGYSCFYNRCRRPENPDSTSCAVLSTTSAQNIAKSCNVQCSSNKDCGVNLRCVDSVCRLATNTSSMSCSPQTYKTVSVVYQNPSAGSKGEEIPLPLESPDASGSGTATSATGVKPIVPPSPSPAPVVTPSPTIGPLETITQLSNTVLGKMGSSLAVIAIVSGVALLLLALFALFSRRPSSKSVLSSTRDVSTPQRPLTPTENHLEQRIKELQQQQTKPASSPTVSALNLAPPPSPAPLVPTPVAVAPASTMMQKIKQKGLDQQIPQPVQS